MKKLSNQKGFTGLEVVLIVIVTALLVGGGVYAYTKSTQSSSNIEVTSGTKAPQGDAPKTQPAKPDESSAIIAAGKAFCAENDITPCTASVGVIKGDLATVKTESMVILVSKKTGTWKYVLGSSEQDICDTGSGSPELLEFCK